MSPGPKRDATEIFADALAVDLGSRPHYLDLECGGDTALRAEVESLLRAHSAAGDFFRAPFGPEAIPAFADGFVGRRLGPYRILRELATGGMGSVYLGERDDSTFQKFVAIKLLRPASGSRFVARFQLERQVLADLDHPGIARLIDGGSTSEGLPYLVMEYVQGMPIDRHCDENRLTIEARLSLFLEVCDAVSYAHQNLVIHRDLKPGNIFVDQTGRPRLLDFGIAKVLEPGPSRDSDTTLLGMRPYTPRYASPEQVRGARMTTASDVYSLGVVLYELLTGSSPHEPLDGSHQDIERIVCEDPPPSPSRAASRGSAESLNERCAARQTTPQRLARRLAGDLDTTLLRALSKEPERRYASVEDLAADLRRHLAGLPVQARPDTATYRLSKFARRNRALVGSVVAIFTTLCAALAVSLHAGMQARARTREVEQLAYVNSLAAAQSSILLNKAADAEFYLAAAPPALRGWEWSHLRSRLDRSVATWRAHDAGITRLAFAPDGARFATASVDSSVKLWEAESGRLIRAWQALGSEVESAAIDPNGRFVAVSLNDGDVRVLPVEANQPQKVLHRGGSWAKVDVSPDGVHIACGFFDGTVIVWDARTHSVVAQWQAHDALALARYSPRGTYLLTGGAEGAAKLWDARTHQLAHVFVGHQRRIMGLAMNAGETRLAIGSQDHSADIWDLATGNRLVTLREHRGSVVNLAFEPGGQRVVSAGTDGQLLIWDPDVPERVAALRGHQSDVSALAADPRGAWIFTGDWSGVIKKWSWNAEDVRTLLFPPVNSTVLVTGHASMDARGTLLACTQEREVPAIWDLTTNAAPVRPDVPASLCAALTPDGAWLVCGDGTGHVAVADTRRGKRLRSFAAHRRAVLGVAIDRAGRHLATASEDSDVAIWSLPDFTLQHRLRGHRAAVREVCFSPAGDRVASCAADSQICVWETSTGRLRKVLRGHQGSVESVAWSPDGSTLASASRDGSVRLWDTREGVQRAVLFQRHRPMTSVAFSASGTRLAASSDQTVRLFDVQRGLELVVLHGHVGRVTSLSFSPHDEILVSTSTDGTLRLWDASVPIPPASATSR